MVPRRAFSPCPDGPVRGCSASEHRDCFTVEQPRLARPFSSASRTNIIEKHLRSRNPTMGRKKIGERLVERGRLSQADLAAALQEQRGKTILLGDLLME